jgi:hypothetical protein
MSHFLTGEIVDITIKGARVIEVCRHGDGNGDDLRFTYEAKDGDQWPSAIWAQAPGVTVERVAPAEWPPRTGDLWRDANGMLYLGMQGDEWSNEDGLVLVDISGEENRANSLLTREPGLTLVHREDEQDGAEPSEPAEQSAYGLDLAHAVRENGGRS